MSCSLNGFKELKQNCPIAFKMHTAHKIYGTNWLPLPLNRFILKMDSLL